jgi:hypothetical protein
MEYFLLGMICLCAGPVILYFAVMKNSALKGKLIDMLEKE